MSDRTLKAIIFGVVLLIGGLASRSIGGYILDSTTNTIFEAIGKPIGDVLTIIGNSILIVYAIGAIIVIAMVAIDYSLQSSSRSQY